MAEVFPESGLAVFLPDPSGFPSSEVIAILRARGADMDELAKLLDIYPIVGFKADGAPVIFGAPDRAPDYLVLSVGAFDKDGRCIGQGWSAIEKHMMQRSSAMKAQHG
jgi:hypothetical protein